MEAQDANAKLARKWALEVRWNENISPGCINKDKLAAADFVLEHTTPETMADVEWDDKEHYLAGATCGIGDTECVMLAPMDGMIANAELGADRLSLTSPGALTPNGKRYKMMEVDQ